MPHLFCAEHGKENYRWFGETVLIVRGRLISGGWQQRPAQPRP